MIILTIVHIWMAISVPCVLAGTWLHIRRGGYSLDIRTVGVLVICGPLSYLLHALYLDWRAKKRPERYVLVDSLNRAQMVHSNPFIAKTLANELGLHMMRLADHNGDQTKIKKLLTL